MDTKCHKDGTITFFSVFQQRRERVSGIPFTELAAMGDCERARVLAHAKRHGWVQVSDGWTRPQSEI